MSTARSSGQPKFSLTLKWAGRGLASLVLAWMSAHFITLGSPRWGPGNNHEAIIFGQMIAIAVFPLLLLISFGTNKPLRGLLISGIICILAALCLLVHN